MNEQKKSRLICLGIYLVFVAIHIVMSQAAKTPLIFADEAGYMGIASKLATGFGESFGYYGGYSVILSIAYLITKDINVVYSIIHIINALIDAFLPILIYIFLGRLNFRLSLSIKAAISVIISLYPHFLTSSNSALPEGLFTNLYLVFIILAYDVLSAEKSNIGKCIAAVLLYIYMCFVHPRALLLLAVFAGFLLYRYCKLKGIQLTVRKCVASLFILLLIGTVFILFIRSLDGSSNYNVNRFAQMILRSLSLQGILDVLIGMVTQYSYLVMATLGVIFFGFYDLCKSHHHNKLPRLFIIFAFVSVLLQSSVFLMKIEWTDHVLYGRYNEAAMIPIVASGLSFLLTAFNKKTLKYLWITSILSFGTTYLFRHEALDNLQINYMNVDSLYIVKLFLPSFQYIWVIILFVVIYLLFHFIFRKWKKAA